jgi:hypothetical protein
MLNLAEFALRVEFLEKEELARVNDRFGHHVLEAGLLHQLDDLLAILDGRRHRHRTHDVLAGFEGRDGHRRVIRNRRIDMHGIDLRILEEVCVALVPGADAGGVADLVELLSRPLANRVHVRERVLLINRNEFGAESEADDGDIGLFAHEKTP